MNTPSERDRLMQLARRIRDAAFQIPPPNKVTPEIVGLCSELDAIAQALADARPPAGHIIDDKGVVRKVLGTLPLTQQGDLIGDGAWCWVVLPGVKGRDDDKPARLMYRACPINDPDAYGGCRVVHSTREAALAAQEPQA